MNASFRLGWQDAQRSLGWVWLTTASLAALLCVGVAGVMEARGVGSASSARQTELDLLTGAAFGLVVPLFIFSLSSRLGGRLDDLLGAAWPRYGADRRVFALGRLSFPALWACTTASLAGVLALGLSSASSDPSLQLPIGLTTGVWRLIGIAALAGASYVAALGLAQLLGGAFGRGSFLVCDWLLGSGHGVTALPWPRSHLRALLGGEPVLGMNDARASQCLLALTLLCLLLYARRVPR